MFSFRRITSGSRLPLVVFSTLTVFVFAGCGNTPTPVTSGTTSISATAHVSISLRHTPSGTADLTWEPKTLVLKVRIFMNGLTPKSVHPGHIHAGTCKSEGSVVYGFSDPIIANDAGATAMTETIQNVKGGIPASGWYINIHNGPDLTPAIQYMPIACGNIVNTNMSTQVTQKVHVELGDATTANQAASGTADLALANGKLTVKIALSGLVPNSKHLAHIHSGSCEVQGKVAYPLNPIVADASGNGTSTTVIDKVSSLPNKLWYVNVHLAQDMAGMSSQTGFDPIACGNVVTQ